MISIKRKMINLISTVEFRCNSLSCHPVLLNLINFEVRLHGIIISIETCKLKLKREKFHN